MDALTESRPGALPTTAPAMPPESHLAMPVQSLSRFDKKARRKWLLPANMRSPWLARLAVFGGGFALTAYGLEGDLDKKALVRKILEEGTDDKKALANRISNTGYKEMTTAFGFGNETGVQTATDGFAAKIVNLYKEHSFESSVYDQNAHLGLVMNFNRKAEMLSEGEGKSWYTVLGDKQLRKVFEGALGLPASFINLDIDKQAMMMEKKAKQVFGSGSLTAFQDQKNVDKLITRFLARAQIEEGGASATGPGASALFLLQHRDSSGSQGLLNLFYRFDG